MKTIDIALVTWPNHPRRFQYFQSTFASLKQYLHASRHEIRYVCSAESHVDPTRKWYGPALSDFCQENGIAYFFKAWGGWVPNEDGCGGDYHFNSKHICLNLAGEVFDGWMEAHGERVAIMAKASKKAAGHLLDGREHHEFPVGVGTPFSRDLTSPNLTLGTSVV